MPNVWFALADDQTGSWLVIDYLVDQEGRNNVSFIFI